MFEPAARVTVAVFEGTAANCVFLGRVKLQLSTMEDGGSIRGGEFQLMTKGADGGGDQGVRAGVRVAV